MSLAEQESPSQIVWFDLPYHDDLTTVIRRLNALGGILSKSFGWRRTLNWIEVGPTPIATDDYIRHWLLEGFCGEEHWS